MDEVGPASFTTIRKLINLFELRMYFLKNIGWIYYQCKS